MSVKIITLIAIAFILILIVLLSFYAPIFLKKWRNRKKRLEDTRKLIEENSH